MRWRWDEMEGEVLMWMGVMNKDGVLWGSNGVIWKDEMMKRVHDKCGLT